MDQELINKIIAKIEMENQLGIPLIHNSPLKIGDEYFETCTFQSEKVKILYVLFEAEDHRDKERLLLNEGLKNKFNFVFPVHY